MRLKKRHVELLTRLPTKRLATACWDFIVAKSTLRQAAPTLDFFALRPVHSQSYPQFINIRLWMNWGQVFRQDSAMERPARPTMEEPSGPERSAAADRVRAPANFNF
jgi:hypothetical protein